IPRPEPPAPDHVPFDRWKKWMAMAVIASLASVLTDVWLWSRVANLRTGLLRLESGWVSQREEIAKLHATLRQREEVGNRSTNEREVLFGVPQPQHAVEEPDGERLRRP